MQTARSLARLGETVAAADWLRQALERNPHDLDALRALRGLLDEGSREAGALNRRIAELVDDERRPHLAPTLSFSPVRPTLNATDPTRVGETTVYDHSLFSVALSNPSGRPIAIDRVVLTSAGTGAPSGLGDIVGSWPFRNRERLLDRW